MSNLHRLELFETCFLGNLVFTFVGIVFEVAHIGDVAHVAHLIPEVFQIAEYEIEGDGGTGGSQMGVTINRWATNIHSDVAGIDGLEEFLGARERIINKKLMFHICVGVLLCHWK